MVHVYAFLTGDGLSQVH